MNHLVLLASPHPPGMPEPAPLPTPTQDLAAAPPARRVPATARVRLARVDRLRRRRSH